MDFVQPYNGPVQVGAFRYARRVKHSVRYGDRLFVAAAEIGRLIVISALAFSPILGLSDYPWEKELVVAGNSASAALEP
jgi:hypothetical protein